MSHSVAAPDHAQRSKVELDAECADSGADTKSGTGPCASRTTHADLTTITCDIKATWDAAHGEPSHDIHAERD